MLPEKPIYLFNKQAACLQFLHNLWHFVKETSAVPALWQPGDKSHMYYKKHKVVCIEWDSLALGYLTFSWPTSVLRSPCLFPYLSVYLWPRKKIRGLCLIFSLLLSSHALPGSTAPSSQKTVLCTPWYTYPHTVMCPEAGPPYKNLTECQPKNSCPFWIHQLCFERLLTYHSEHVH